MTLPSALFDIGLILQPGPGPGFEPFPAVDPGVGLGGSAFGAFLSTLLIGGILVALAPGYTERLMDRVRDDAVGSFIYGLLALVATVLLGVVGWLVWRDWERDAEGGSPDEPSASPDPDSTGPGPGEVLAAARERLEADPTAATTIAYGAALIF